MIIIQCFNDNELHCTIYPALEPSGMLKCNVLYLLLFRYRNTVKNKPKHIAHDVKNSNVKQKVVYGLSKVSGYAETNKEKVSFARGHVPFNYISVFTIS